MDGRQAVVTKIHEAQLRQPRTVNMLRTIALCKGDMHVVFSQW